MRWSTHYRWRTRTTGGVHTRRSTLLLHHWGPAYWTPDAPGKKKTKKICSDWSYAVCMGVIHSSPCIPNKPLHYLIVYTKLLLTLHMQRLRRGWRSAFFTLLGCTTQLATWRKLHDNNKLHFALCLKSILWWCFLISKYMYLNIGKACKGTYTTI